MRFIILGAAAGGGLPQWNCGCSNCDSARTGRIKPLSQSSIAMTSDGESWSIINASPDIRQQLSATTALFPSGPRDVPIRSVILTNGDIDHVAGLLTLREKQPFTLRATQGILDILAANPVFDVLDTTLVDRAPIVMDGIFEPVPGIWVTAFAVPGKVPLYLEGEAGVEVLEGEQTVGLEFRTGSSRAYYVPGCAQVTPLLAERLRGADVLFFDGTLWTDDEMIRLGLGQKTGRRMGHMPISGPDGSIAALADLRIARKIYIHINNSNPIVDPASEEAAAVREAGWEIGYDGQDIRL